MSKLGSGGGGGTGGIPSVELARIRGDVLGGRFGTGLVSAGELALGDGGGNDEPGSSANN